jgi:hypothetical protein
MERKIHYRALSDYINHIARGNWWDAAKRCTNSISPNQKCMSLTNRI